MVGQMPRATSSFTISIAIENIRAPKQVVVEPGAERRLCRGLSRVRRKKHARFLGGWARVTAPGYPAWRNWQTDRQHGRSRNLGSVALVIRQRNFAGTALRRSNWTEHSRQRRKLVGERHRMRAVVRELALADHVDQFDAGEDGAGGAE